VTDNLHTLSQLISGSRRQISGREADDKSGLKRVRNRAMQRQQLGSAFTAINYQRFRLNNCCKSHEWQWLAGLLASPRENNKLLIHK
jgi:hypothetical protein